jgi:hypothetical protein
VRNFTPEPGPDASLRDCRFMPLGMFCKANVSGCQALQFRSQIAVGYGSSFRFELGSSGPVIGSLEECERV